MTLHALRQVVHLLGNFLLLVHLSGTLQQTRVQIEHITRICLTSRRTTQNQRYLTISDSLFREVIIHHKGSKTTVTEILTDSSTSKRSIILHRCRISSRSGYHDGIRHSTVLLQSLNKSSYGRCLLTDGNINTINWFSCLKETLLVDNGINGNSGLTRLTVTNNQLTLSTTNRNHGVDSL